MRLSRHEQEPLDVTPARPASPDPEAAPASAPMADEKLGPARGMVIGLGIAIVFWAVVGLVFFLLR